MIDLKFLRENPEIVKENLIRFYSKSNGEIDGRAAVCDYFAAEREMLKKGDFDIFQKGGKVELY